MKFEKIISEKNLNVEELPKRLQKKISELQDVVERIKELESSGSKLSEDEAENLSLAKLKVNSLDRELEKALKKFDPLVYKYRKDRMAKINEEKYRKDAESSEPEEAKDEEITEDADEAKEDEVFEEKEVVQPEQFELAKEPAISKTQRIKDDLDRLRQTAEIKPEQFQESRKEQLIAEPEVIEPEVEEFEKADNAQPKKISKGLILMGVGAFLLTWGAVNFFKERRG